jgi:hypothetical protein
MEETFVLNLTTMAAIGGIMGILTGAISFLTKTLIASKDVQIESLKAEMLRREEQMQKDIDYYRDFTQYLLEPAEQVVRDNTMMQQRRPPKPRDTETGG